ncbi:MAG: hypothetical protein ABI702_17075 [Burkholderiales bacterium]
MDNGSLIASLIDLVIAFTLIEGVVLLLVHRITGRGVAAREFVLNMASGLCLMLALRGLVRDAGVPWLALCLLAAGVAHGADLWLRWQRGATAAGERRVVA